MNGEPPSEAARFLHLLFAGCDGRIEIRPLPPGQHPPRFCPCAEAAEAVRYALSLDGEVNVYFGAATRMRDRGTKADIQEVPGLWADCDSPGSVAAIQAFPFPPTIEIETSPARRQFWWLLKEPLLIESEMTIGTVEGVLRGIAERLESDSSVAELARVMRLPGTTNIKRGGALCRLLRDDGPRYNLADFPDAGIFRASNPVSGNGHLPAGLDTAAVLAGVPEGERDTSLFKLACKFRRVGVPREAAERFVLEAASKCEPPFPADAAREKVGRAYQRYPPAPAVEVDSVRPAALPEIEIGVEVRPLVDAAIEALIAADLGICQRGQSLVRVIRESGRPRNGITRPEGAPIIMSIGDAGLLELLTDAARWIKIDKKGNRTLVHPPKCILAALLSRGSWPGVPWLEGVISSPAMRADGSILCAPGYDPKTGLLLDTEGVTFPAVLQEPTQEQARKALADLVEPFSEFPFRDTDVGLAACVAAVLTLIGRPAIAGPCPMFPVRSTTPGSGKGLLVDTILVIGTGREPARMFATRGREGDAEMRKRILALAMEGDAAVLIDNVETVLGSATLAGALTACEVKDRVLGENRTARAPLLAVWFCTGNGLSFRGDLGRRVVPIDLDPGVEHPEDRTGPKPGQQWTHADLLGYVREHRPQLVTAGLTVLRAYVVTGRPGHGRPAKGGFEAWDRLIRGAVIWAGAADPLDACQVIREEADADLDALRAVLLCWREVFGDRALTAADAVKEGRERGGELLAALAGLAGCEEVRLDARALGTALKRLKGRLASGLRFEKGREDRKAKVVRWCVEEV